MCWFGIVGRPQHRTQEKICMHISAVFHIPTLCVHENDGEKGFPASFLRLSLL